MENFHIRFDLKRFLKFIGKPFMIVHRGIQIGLQERADYEVARLLHRFEYRGDPFDTVLNKVKNGDLKK